MLWAWGANDRHQIGDGTNGDALTPVQIMPGVHWTIITAGANFSFAAAPPP